jgi:hypothetical protein
VTSLDQMLFVSSRQDASSRSCNYADKFTMTSSGALSQEMQIWDSCTTLILFIMHQTTFLFGNPFGLYWGICFSIPALHFHHFLMYFYVSAFFQLTSNHALAKIRSQNKNILR